VPDHADRSTHAHRCRSGISGVYAPSVQHRHVEDGTQIRATSPAFTHGDWVQVFIDPDPSGRGPGYIRITEKWGTPGVVVLPILQRHRLGLVQVFRHPVGRLCWEAPRGFGEAGSTPSANALRELVEETGFVPTVHELVHLGQVLHNAGIAESVVDIYAVDFQSAPPGEPLDSREISGFRWFDVAEVEQMISEGVIQDSFTIVSLFHAMSAGLVTQSPRRRAVQ